MFEREKSAGYLVNYAARLFGRRLHGAIAPLGLAPAQFLVLLELWEEDGLTQADLVSRLNVEQATLANTMSRMERDGLVERREKRGDRRARLIYLTDKARALEDEAKRNAAQINAFALAGLEEGERDQFLEALERVIDTLAADQP